MRMYIRNACWQLPSTHYFKLWRIMCPPYVPTPYVLVHMCSCEGLAYVPPLFRVFWLVWSMCLLACSALFWVLVRGGVGCSLACCVGVAFCGWWVCLLACWLVGSLAFAAQKMVTMGIRGSEIDAVAH